MKKIILAILIISPMVLYSQGLVSNGTERIYNGWLNSVQLNGFETAIVNHESGLLFGMHSSNKFFFGRSSDKVNLDSYSMTIDAASGNIGIGTIHPEAKLHIAGDGYTLYGPNSSWGQYLKIGGGEDTSDVAATIFTSNGNLHIDAKKGDFVTAINYHSKNNTIINPVGGNVGIGIGAGNKPLWRLHVAGNAPDSVALFENKNPNQFAQIQALSDTGFVVLGSLGSASTEPNWLNSNYLYSYGKPKFQIKSDGSIVFATNGFEEVNTRMVISINGNVGIGTINPDEKLVVNGTIKATKISVVETIAAADFKIAGSDEWADYVFSEDYNLRSLSEVDNFININGHLPEMPTAEEVSANGYELAKVNALLLKKIEELTLYTIELDKKIAALEGNK